MTSLRTKAPTSHQASCAAVLRRRAPSKNVVQVPLLSALMEMARFAFTPEVRWNSNEEICQKTSCFSLFFQKHPKSPMIIITFPQFPAFFIIFSDVFICSYHFLMILSIFSSYHFPRNAPRSVRGPSAHQGPERRQRGFGGDRTGAIGPRGEDHRHGRARLLRWGQFWTVHIIMT